MTANRMHLGDDRDVGAALSGFDRRAHPGKAAADHDDVVLDHVLFAPLERS